MIHITRTRAGAALAACAVAASAATGIALAHTEVESTSPRSGATVSPSRSVVTVTFGAAIRGGSIKVTGPAGTVSRGGGRDPRKVSRLRTGLKTPLRAGSYRVAWTATAADGHRQRGSFSFRVRR